MVLPLSTIRVSTNLLAVTASPMVRSPCNYSRASNSAVRSDDDPRLVVLVEQLTSGHVEALSRLYHLTVKQLYSTAYSIVRSKMDAEEIVCDVFFYAWCHGHQYDPARGSVMAWLTVSVRNRSISLLRKRRNYTILKEVLCQLLVAEIVCGTDQILEKAQAAQRLQFALAELPFLRRRLIELAFFQQLTHQEIAKVLGMPTGTVKSHIRRALRKIGSEITWCV
jgi:RNA polymerase sigma-70 factor, ECF subfamily